MAAIFINYRRSENKLHAQLIYQHLIDTYKNEDIFIDTESIEAGEPFPDRIKRSINKSKVMISFVGESWGISRDPANTNKIHPEDWVGMEISIALKKGIKIIPILVESATMPNEKNMPSEISAFVFLNAINIKFNQPTDPGIERLKSAINASIPNIKKKEEITINKKIEEAIKITIILACLGLLAFSNPKPEEHSSKIQKGIFSNWRLYKNYSYENNVVFSKTKAIINNQEIHLSYGFLGLIIESKEYEQIQQNALSQ